MNYFRRQNRINLVNWFIKSSIDYFIILLIYSHKNIIITDDHRTEYMKRYLLLEIILRNYWW